MSKPKIGIIVGSVREGRFAQKALDWFKPIADKRTDLEFEVLDLKDFDLPFYDEPVSPSMSGDAANPEANRWRKKLDAMDGFVVITAEYNHGPTAVLKNAIDWAWYEWNQKPISFVGYGNSGASRAIEQLRAISVELEMVPIRRAVHVGGSDMMAIWTEGKSIADFPYYEDGANEMLTSLNWWARTLVAARSEQKKAA